MMEQSRSLQSERIYLTGRHVITLSPDRSILSRASLFSSTDDDASDSGEILSQGQLISSVAVYNNTVYIVYLDDGRVTKRSLDNGSYGVTNQYQIQGPENVVPAGIAVTLRNLYIMDRAGMIYVQPNALSNPVGNQSTGWQRIMPSRNAMHRSLNPETFTAIQVNGLDHLFALNRQGRIVVVRESTNGRQGSVAIPNQPNQQQQQQQQQQLQQQNSQFITR